MDEQNTHGEDEMKKETPEIGENVNDTEATESVADTAGQTVEQTEKATYEEKGKKQSPFADAPYERQFPQEPEHPAGGKKHRHHPAVKNWAAVIAITLAVSAASSGITAWIVSSSCRHQLQIMNQAMEEKLAVLEAAAVPEPSAPTVKPGKSQGMTPGEIYNANAASVVSVMSTVKEKNELGQESLMESSGSGFIASADGFVVTNCHVVEGAESVTVRDHNGEVYEAKIVGKDAANDVALLKIEAENLQPVEMGTCDDLSVGDPVVTIGHPLGSQNAILTVGYVSAKNQVVYTDGSSLDMIQTDAAINAGNSGGPLFDPFGRVIGITTAKYSGYASGGASIEGVGYAIPIDDVLDILEDLKQFGKVKRSYLGVMVKNVDSHAQEYGLPAGAFVEEATEGLAAYRAGIRNQDIIVELGGHKVTSVSDLTRVLRKFKAGEEVTAKLWHGGQYRYVTIVLDAKPEETPKPAEPQETTPAPQMPSQLPEDWFDFFGHFFGH